MTDEVVMADQPVVLLRAIKTGPDGPKSKLQERVNRGEVTHIWYHRVGNVGVYWPVENQKAGAAVPA